MTQPLAGKVVLVTGASTGIGAHLALVAGAAGARLAVAARRIDRLQALIAMHPEIECHLFELDVTDPVSCRLAIDSVRKRLGGIDILVNNAGIAVTAAASTTSDADWDQVLATNLGGPARLCRLCAQDWIECERPGTIVNVGSIFGLAGGVGISSYCASKAALTNLSRALAVEWARHHIRVNVLAPGYIETDLNRSLLQSRAGDAIRQRIPLGRTGMLADLDGPFLLLCSEASRFMTGTVLVVDGGQMALS